MAPNDGTLMIENARIIFRNFAGKETKYNRAGDRNFCVLLEDELARQMTQDGWHIKVLKAREDGDQDQAYIQVTVRYGKGRPPRVVMVTSRGRTDLDEEMVEVLDWADVRIVDLIIRPYEWVVGGKTGISAYLKSMFVTIEEDALEMKYADLDQVPARFGKVSE